MPITFFQNDAGLVIRQPAGYAELRYLPGKRVPTDLAVLLTHLGSLLLLQGWSQFLADNRQMTPFTPAEKEWFITQWLGHQVARPVPLVGVVVLPLDVFARLSFMEMYSHAATTSIRYITCADITEAKAYLANLR